MVKTTINSGWWTAEGGNHYLRIVAIGSPERHMRRASHCGSKQQ